MGCSLEIFSGVSRLLDARTGNRNGRPGHKLQSL